MNCILYPESYSSLLYSHFIFFLSAFHNAQLMQAMMNKGVYGLFIILVQDWISYTFKTTNLTSLTELVDCLSISILDQEFKE